MPSDPIPRGARVLVRLFDDHETPSGIVLPDSAARPSRGIITHVGSEQDELDPGDEVLFFKSRGIQIVVGEETLFLLEDREILLVLSKARVL